MDLPKKYDPRLPRVSDIVDYFYPFPRDKIDPEALKFSIDRGKLIHSYLESFIKNDTLMTSQLWAKMGSIPNAIKMAERGVAILKKLQKKYYIFNTEEYKKNKYYQGTMDVFVDYQLIIDWKTGTQAKESNLFQMWLYRQLTPFTVADMVLCYLYHDKVVSYNEQNKKYNLDEKFERMYDEWVITQKK